MLVVPLRGKQAILIPLRVSSLKRSTAGAFVVPFRVLSRKHMTGDNALLYNWYRPRSENSLKPRPWYLLGLPLKIFDVHPRPFYMGVFSGGG